MVLAFALGWSVDQFYAATLAELHWALKGHARANGLDKPDNSQLTRAKFAELMERYPDEPA